MNMATIQKGYRLSTPEEEAANRGIACAACAQPKIEGSKTDADQTEINLCNFACFARSGAFIVRDDAPPSPYRHATPAERAGLDGPAQCARCACKGVDDHANLCALEGADDCRRFGFWVAEPVEN
jgi:hypothetical protein